MLNYNFLILGVRKIRYNNIFSSVNMPALPFATLELIHKSLFFNLASMLLSDIQVFLLLVK